MALSWKAFKFFDVAQVKLPEDEIASLSEGNITSVASGSENVFLGSTDGQVRILSHTFKVVRTYKAHDEGAITHMKQVQGTSLLVTIAEDSPKEPVLKVWALDKVEKKTGMPRCQSTLTIHNGRRPFPITAFAALEDLSQLAVGFGNGSVTVVRGDLIHDRGAKQRTVFETEEPITGIEFREGNTTTLYIATTGKISTLIISGRGQGQPARSLEDTGCAAGCMCVDNYTRDVIVARNDAIYSYGLAGRGPVHTYEGPKDRIGIFKDYVAVVSPPRTNTNIRTGVFRAFGVGQADDLFNTSRFTILNTDLKFIAYEESLSSRVKAIFSEWGDFFVMTDDGKLFRYREKTLQQKLDVLYQRNYYILAISLAQKSGVTTAQLNVILRRYGDHLYQKQDYDTAMQQYLKAIDNTEPSQVIRKVRWPGSFHKVCSDKYQFLDSQRIQNLIEYLEELHEHHRATSDHTTLLLNCYAKLKDVKKLEEFIKSPGDLKFDLDTAISMCRQGGYFDQAAYLARKHNEHELVVDILIEDSKLYAEALAYIWRLEPEEAFHNITKYATVLLEHCPRDATTLFIDYYIGQFRPKKDTVVVQNVATSSGGMVSTASNAVQNLAALLPLPYMNANAAQTSNEEQKSTMSQTQIVEMDNDDSTPEYKIPKPRSAFSAFVDHPDEFVTFLESCINSQKLGEDDKTDLYTTLFEMYIHTARNKKDEEREEWETKAKKLIEGKNIPIDTSNVLLLSHLSNFRDGTILVREQQGLRFDIFRSYTNAKDTKGAIKALRKYGPEDPQLYPAALAYLTSSPAILQEAGDELDAVLRKIDDDGLMAPLQVIQTLSANGVATMGMIKKYLSGTIERERQEISNNRRTTATFKKDTAEKLAELETLNTKPEVFQTTRCSACGNSLDLPTVRFLCKHSFHLRCLNVTQEDDIESGDVECPICAPNNATIKAIRKAQLESAERHDLFKDALKSSQDGFGTISEWMGRGVMGVE
ncbi:vacuolar protein sorting-associated protein 11 [Pseudovirgaria hyperparasitica]|uniref:E3 ubiquitin-protein ligase PEP5 n=1 Tax=Pseudovirgaria hyperparasitica TaxID=470096 RepID=A0A6A6WG41_9PEZI|nr:vacuolar protein sorting-associated protein 11 [Pseudovirgaria hyperparasitica]KAF2761758.1 vacuolar protein sorting-associated protein 11 [Pseudovirgaria hyperparasitica]